MERAEEIMESILKETPLRDEAKRKIIEEGKRIFSEIEGRFSFLKRAKGNTIEKVLNMNARIALFLACDKTFCAIPRHIKKKSIKAKQLAEIRRALNINVPEALDRLPRMCELLKNHLGAEMEGKTIRKIENIARDYLEKFKRDYTTKYYSYSPMVLATAVIYIAC
ncbi:MAG: hypothetical protein ACXQTS_06090, partial [Candidatus Methanospirareceae archaeon]